METLKDKAMIIIAVSRYSGAYPDLPGAVISARKLREWAEQQDEDRSYRVLYLGDDEYDKIDVNLVREKVSEFIDSSPIDRLVVYFAGHGIARSAGEQFWLLTDAANDLGEGIQVDSFKRGLLKCNIGASNDQIKGQLCIIGDACRDTNRDVISFSGHPILTKSQQSNKSIEFDRFLSTSLGAYSLQIDASDEQNAYCLFSETLLQALSGEIGEAVETEHHKFQPVVTNHTLANYLEKTIPTRAAALEEDMMPDISTGIRPPYNFYKLLKELPQTKVVSQDIQLTETSKMAVDEFQEKDNADNLSRDQKYQKQILLQTMSQVDDLLFRGFRTQINAAFPNSWDIYSRKYENFTSNFPPHLIAAPFGARFRLFQNEGYYMLVGTYDYGLPILVNQGPNWVLIPNFSYPGFSSIMPIILQELASDILLYEVSAFEEEINWNLFLSDFSILIGNRPLRAAEAQKFADGIRSWKELFPLRAIIAGYLYEYSNDYNNITRTAHYMAHGSALPFDLALLCADKIEWRKEDDRFVAFADLPAVKREEREENASYKGGSERPYYTETEFEERKQVRLWGIVPIFRQGWSFMQTEKYLEIPEPIQRIGDHTTGRSATSLTREGLEIFLETFNYRIIDINAKNFSDMIDEGV